MLTRPNVKFLHRPSVIIHGNCIGYRPSHSSHCLQVLKDVPEPLVMRVFLNAPCTLQGQLPRLPQSLTALSVLANLPSLAKVCSVQPESPIARAELCAREDHIELY